MKQVYPLFKREFLGYFRSPVAYVFVIVFLVGSVGLSFFGTQFFKAGLASMERYFWWYPWFFLFLVPAAGMGLWSEERRSGTIELLFTLPVTTLEAVTGKFLAAWAFLSVAILASFTMALTVRYLGHPDWGVVISSYVGSILMAGAYLGVCSLMSALTRNQVISFVLSVASCLFLVLLGVNWFSDFLGSFLGLPVPVVDLIANFSFFTHFSAFTQGVIDPKDLIFFLSLTGFTLFLNVVALER
jgi:gliding motility-associated transport system permease protein